MRPFRNATETANSDWRGIGYRHSNGGYSCRIFPQEDSVRLLFEYGAFILDSDCLLEGNGKQIPYVQIRRLKDIRVRPLERLVRAALEFRQR